MSERPAAPIVTITDPSRPAALSDVIGEDRPERLSRRQKRWTWVAVGVVAVGAAGVWGAQQLLEQRRLDQAAIREIALSFTGDDTIANGAADVTVISQGAHPVTVLSVGLDLPDLPALTTAPAKVVTGNPAIVNVRLPRTCPAQVRGTPRHAILKVRTYRGNETAVKVNLASGTRYITDLVYAVLAPCGGPVSQGFRTTVSFQHANEPGYLPFGLTIRSSVAVPRELRTLGTQGGLAFQDSIELSSQAPSILLAADPGAIAVLADALYLDDCDVATKTWTAGATDGIRAGVVGSDAPGPLLIPFDDPTVRRFVKTTCDAIARTGVVTPRQASPNTFVVPGRAPVPVTLTGTGIGTGPVTVTFRSPSPAPSAVR